MKFIGTIALVLSWATVFAQSRQITGRIVDEESQKGVPGATITISDTRRSTITNQLGYFALKVEPADKSLVIASLGYLTSKIDVPAVEAFKAPVKREYLKMEPLDLGYFSVEILDPPDTLEAPSFEQPEMDAEYPGGWQYVYNTLAQALKVGRNDLLFSDSTWCVQFTVLANGTISGVRSPGASDSVKKAVEAAFKMLRPWKPARQNQFNVAQHFELPLLWSDEIYTVVEETATPVEGIESYFKKIGKSIKYPAQARRMGVEGTVLVEFLIQKDGSITNVTAVRGVGSGLDEEAVRIISLGPKWNPGKQRGKIIVQRYTLPIKFSLDGPSFAGGDSSTPMVSNRSAHAQPKILSEWLAVNVKYPADARRKGLEGLVVVSFKVKEGGEIFEIRIDQDIGAGCGDEAVRALRAVPAQFLMPVSSMKIGGRTVFQPFQFHLGSDTKPRPAKPDLRLWDLHENHLLHPVEIIAMGIERSYRSQGMSGPRNIWRPDLLIPKSYKSFEEALARPRMIEELSLVSNSITSVPADIDKFRSLKFLDLENNQIKRLPPEIGTLGKLKEFFVPLNQLNELPIEFANLQSLRVLGLAGNHFEQFPKPVLGLTKLTALDLSGNKMSALPPAIGEMRDLQTLILHNNQISTIPEEFYQLTQLKVLSLGGNPISEKDKERIRNTFKKTEVKFD